MFLACDGAPKPEFDARREEPRRSAQFLRRRGITPKKQKRLHVRRAEHEGALFGQIVDFTR